MQVGGLRLLDELSDKGKSEELVASANVLMPHEACISHEQ